MSNLTTIGLLVIMITVGGSVQQLGGAHSLGSFGLIVSLLGVIFGANLIFLGVKMTGSPAAVSLGAMASLATTYLHHNLAMVGHFTVSFAIMVYGVAGSGTTIGLALSAILFMMFLVGVSMITLGVHGGLN